MGIVNIKFLENSTYTKNDGLLVDICIGVFIATLNFILDGSIKRNFHQWGSYCPLMRNKVRIVNYTDEGDPIFQTLDYDGININYLFDDSNDKFGGSHKGKKVMCVKGLWKKKAVKT